VLTCSSGAYVAAAGGCPAPRIASSVRIASCRRRLGVLISERAKQPHLERLSGPNCGVEEYQMLN
jgi:hypothetical protein